MQVPPAAHAQRLLVAFHRLKQLMLGRVGPRIQEEHDLELSELQVLRRIGESNLSPTELAEVLRVPPPAISRRLDQLESAGLIVRKLDKVDARRRVLTLTPRGQTLLGAATQTLEREVDKILSVLSSEEIERLVATLERITDTTQENE